MTDYTALNKDWSQESLELLKQLNELTTTEELGWRKVKHLENPTDGTRNFLKPCEDQGKFVEYEVFRNPSLKCLKGVVHFGIYTAGPPG